MNFRILDMGIIAAKDLKQVNHFFRMDVYALASVQGYNNNLYNSLQKTPIDKDGGSNPIWNFPVKFLIDVVAAENNCLTLVIKLKADGNFGDKDIGEVHVPVKELLDKYGASNDEMHASYDVRTTLAGKFKGVLNFSFKFGDALAAALGPSVAAPPTPGGHPYPLAPGYGGYPYPLAPGYGGYPLPQLQPQEETKMGCQYCFIKRTDSPKSSYTVLQDVTFSYHRHGLEESHILWQSFVLNFVQRQTLHESFQSQWLVQICIL
ncbi:hypothetical protein ACB092_03G043500 [Castanea dentata]